MVSIGIEDQLFANENSIGEEVEKRDEQRNSDETSAQHDRNALDEPLPSFGYLFLSHAKQINTRTTTTIKSVALEERRAGADRGKKKLDRRRSS